MIAAALLVTGPDLSLLCSLDRLSCAPGFAAGSERGKRAHIPARPILSHPACLLQIPGRLSNEDCTCLSATNAACRFDLCHQHSLITSIYRRHLGPRWPHEYTQPTTLMHYIARIVSKLSNACRDSRDCAGGYQSTTGRQTVLKGLKVSNATCKDTVASICRHGPTRQSCDVKHIRPCTLVMFRLRCTGGKHLNLPIGQLAREVRGLPVGAGVL